MAKITLTDLLESGMHFGHQISRWHPATKPYIFGSKKGIHIFDLTKTYELLEKAQKFTSEIIGEGGVILFVGTKKQAADIVRAEAQRCEMPFIVDRWLGGTLTNFRTIMRSLAFLEEIETKLEDAEKLSKKEISRLKNEQQKLQQKFEGLRQTTNLPQALFIIDLKKEDTALKEAKLLGIPVVAVVDSNADPRTVEYPITGNDDARKSIQLICSQIADAVIEGREKYAKKLVKNTKTDAKPEHKIDAKI